MPIYVFTCSTCGLTHDLLVAAISRRDDPRPCPQCSGPTVRQVTSAAWQLGSGPPESHISKAIQRVKARGL